MGNYCTFFLYLIAIPVYAQGTNTTVELQTAEHAYQEKNYEKAHTLYTKLLKKSPNSANLLFNLASVEIKIGMLGRAYAHLLRAQRNSPLDSDIRYNTKLLYQALSEEKNLATVPSQTVLGSTFLGSIPLSLWLCLMLLFSALGLLLFKRGGFPLTASSFFALLFAIVSASVFYNHYHEAVVVGEEPVVRSGPNDGFPEVLLLAQGSLVAVEEKNKQWAKIRFRLVHGSSDEDIIGWLKIKTLDILANPRVGFQ